jgi:AcrR family transcriptional regulator
MSSMIEKKSRAKKADDVPAPPEGTRRLAREDREELIVQKAIKYFATHGFGASTRDLAKEIGVSQPLLNRYFPNKEALADRVFH